ncbi:MAG TPA: biotin transporter BioY [Candidatus Nanopelagicales bacterium]
MSTTSLVPARVLADLVPGGLVRDGALVLGGAGLVGLFAQLSVSLPFTPVPITGQTFAVLLVGATLGTIRGVLSMMVYALAGMAGVPWFADHSSGVALASFGYIVGFIVAAGVVGRLAERGATRTPLRTAAIMVVGSLVIYAFGVTWLKTSLGVSWSSAIALGLTPFLLGDAVKVAVAAGLFPTTWRLVQRPS